MAVEPGRDRGRGGLAGFAVAAVAAGAGFGGHYLGGLEQGPGQPVQLREDHLGVARREVEQAPCLVQDIQAGQDLFVLFQQTFEQTTTGETDDGSGSRGLVGSKIRPYAKPDVGYCQRDRNKVM